MTAPAAPPQRWPVAPKVKAAGAGAGLGALIVQLILAGFHIDSSSVYAELVQVLVPLILAAVGGYLAPHQNRSAGGSDEDTA